MVDCNAPFILDSRACNWRYVAQPTTGRFNFLSFHLLSISYHTFNLNFLLLIVFFSERKKKCQMKKKQVLRVFLFCFFYFFFGFGFFFHTRSAVDQLFLGRYQTKFIVLHCCTIFSVKQKTSWLYATSERKQSSKSNCWLIYLTERSQHSPATTTQTCSMLMHRCIQTMFRLRIMPIAGTEYTDITQASHTCLIETRFVLFYSDLNTFGIYMGISGWCRYGVGIRPPKIQFIFMFCANWCISKFFMQHFPIACFRKVRLISIEISIKSLHS